MTAGQTWRYICSQEGDRELTLARAKSDAAWAQTLRALNGDNAQGIYDRKGRTEADRRYEQRVMAEDEAREERETW